jgi:hypothetical protein
VVVGGTVVVGVVVVGGTVVVGVVVVGGTVVGVVVVTVVVVDVDDRQFGPTESVEHDTVNDNFTLK